MTHNRALAVASISLLGMASLFFAGCGGSSSQSTTTTYPTHTPKYLVALDIHSGNDVEVMSINATTGALTPVSGSPFSSLGLVDPYAVTTHPNGNWVYACDWNDGSGNTPFVVGFTLSGAGVPSVINSIDTDEANGCDYTNGLNITPAGTYLYAAGDDNVITAYSINQTTGALTAVGKLTVTSGDILQAMTSTDTTIYAAGNDGVIYISAIQASGVPSSSFTFLAVAGTPRVYSLAVDATQKYLLAGDNVGNLYVYSITSDGSLTLKSTTTLKLATGSTKNGFLIQIAFSVDQKFLYVADNENGLHALSFSNGVVSELTGSPYTPTYNGSPYSVFYSVQVDPSNQFVYAAGTTDGVFSWTRDTSTGTLTSIGQTPVAYNIGTLTTTF
jgi:hypothetical protein